MTGRRVQTDRDSALSGLAEAFREHGFEGASLAVLSKATGLGKGSLYNFFPSGKEEMMEAVLIDIDRWFAETIFSPLEHVHDPRSAITRMMQDVTAYFRSGGRICLVGSLGLNAAGQAFAIKIKSYFARWISALAHCLQAGNVPSELGVRLAEEAVSAIQGAIVLARALGDDMTFNRIVQRQLGVLLDAVASHSASH